MKHPSQVKREMDQLRHVTNQLLEAQKTIQKLEAEKISLKLTLGACIKSLRGATRLLEAWAYGPAFRKAGHRWPDGNCDAPDYLAARRWLKLYDQENDE